MPRILSYPQDIEVRSAYELLRRKLLSSGSVITGESFSSEDLAASLNQLRDYVFKKSDAWSLDGKIVNLMENIFKKCDKGDKAKFVKVLAQCALRKDFHTLLMNDRQRVLMDYLRHFSTLSVEEQSAVSLLVCNISSQEDGLSWLLFFSRWENALGEETTNANVCEVLLRAAVTSLNPVVRKYALATATNISFRHLSNKAEYSGKQMVAYDAFMDSIIASLKKAKGNGKLKADEAKVCEEVLLNFSMASGEMLINGQNGAS